MQKVWESLTLFYHFLMCGDWKRIELCSGRPQQAFGIVCRLWITLQYSFQFWNFWWKMQSLFVILSAASWFCALGLCSGFYEECFRFAKQVQNLCSQCFWDLISMVSFSIFFMWRTCQSLPITLILSLLNSARNLEWILCTKRFEKHGLVFFL